MPEPGHEYGRQSVSMSQVYAAEQQIDKADKTITSIEGRALLSLIKLVFKLLAQEHGWRR